MGPLIIPKGARPAVWNIDNGICMSIQMLGGVWVMDGQYSRQEKPFSSSSGNLCPRRADKAMRKPSAGVRRECPAARQFFRWTDEADLGRTN